MGIFGNNQSDAEWLTLIRPPYHAASEPMRELDRALADGSRENQHTAVQHVLDRLTFVENTVKKIRSPSSNEAQHVHKRFKSALNNYRSGARQGALFFKDLAGGPGQRAIHETGVARKAAVSRLVFNESLLRNLAQSGSKDMDAVSRFLE